MRQKEAGPVGAVVVAAGLSSRMDGVDKLFAPVAGRPLLAYTLSAFQACPAVEKVALVLGQPNLERGRGLACSLGLEKVMAICLGGERRQDSVRAGLLALQPCAWVVVHDGARPLVTADLIQEGLAVAAETGAAAAAVPIADTLKEVANDGLVRCTVSRHGLWAVQTPQVFSYDLLLMAHQQVGADVTDDAALVEHLGHPVKLYPGSRRNIKVTSPEDLALVEALLSVP
ncbi:MAG: 2-C-methyl-D-erythritol 4-phosphate cytidylyltransferase [Dehalococcoidia bacterium]